MLPAKSRERKCSTCRHYQASPLWRKGWCRNPLLYDRNTNHLVEADSLACNRTFIDYWEPVTEGAGPAGSSTQRGKPRIAPSIPMDTVDAKGQPVDNGDYLEGAYDTDSLDDERSTPVSGARAVGSQPVYRPATFGRERPPLALVDEDYDELLEGTPRLKDTQQLATLDRTQPSPGVKPAARDRMQRARQSKRPNINFGIPRLSGIPLYATVGALAVMLVVVAALFIFNRAPAATDGLVAGQPTVPVVAVATPTGFGDPTPTVVAGTQPTTPPVRTDILAVGGFAQVTGTGDGLIARSSPSREGARVAKLADGTKARIIDGPQEADGFTWWKLDQFDEGDPDLSGWSVATYLKPTAP